jgi:hypothetical protein
MRFTVLLLNVILSYNIRQGWLSRTQCHLCLHIIFTQTILFYVILLCIILMHLTVLLLNVISWRITLGKDELAEQSVMIIYISFSHKHNNALSFCSMAFWCASLCSCWMSSCRITLDKDDFQQNRVSLLFTYHFHTHNTLLRHFAKYHSDAPHCATAECHPEL